MRLSGMSPVTDVGNGAENVGNAARGARKKAVSQPRDRPQMNFYTDTHTQ